MPDWIRRVMSGVVGLSHNHNLKLLSSMLKESNSARAFAFSRSISKDFNTLVSTNVLNNTKGIQDMFEYSASKFPKNIDAGEGGMRLDIMHTLSDDYLQKVDIASMAFSLETRAPILSREIVEWGMRLPINWKLRGRTSKYLLRKLAYRYIPRPIIDRPKQGFGVPIDSWLRNELSDFAEERIYNSQYYIGLPLDQESVIDLYKLHKSGERNSHPLLWAVIMLLEFNSSNK
jgi:asparagine synthase (glutamine-hydrolysing)